MKEIPHVNVVASLIFDVWAKENKPVVIEI